MPSNESASSTLLCAPAKMSGSTNSITNCSSSSTNSNSNSNSNGNSDVPEDCSLFKFYMEKCYVLPLELKNDLIYCQRAMRDFLKVHGVSRSTPSKCKCKKKKKQMQNRVKATCDHWLTSIPVPVPTRTTSAVAHSRSMMMTMTMMMPNNGPNIQQR